VIRDAAGQNDWQKNQTEDAHGTQYILSSKVGS
jgi:hypothetical protein